MHNWNSIDKAPVWGPCEFQGHGSRPAHPTKNDQLYSSYKETAHFLLGKTHIFWFPPATKRNFWFPQIGCLGPTSYIFVRTPTFAPPSPYQPSWQTMPWMMISYLAFRPGRSGFQQWSFSALLLMEVFKLKKKTAWCPSEIGTEPP